MIEIPHVKIQRFLYNGFHGQLRRGKTRYFVTSFVEWTRDPGIGVFECSDGKRRLIPSFAFIECWKEIKYLIPEQDMTNKVYFGAPCKS
jgi:hypothetical protein